MRLRSFNLIVVLLPLVCIPLFAHPQSEPTLLDAAHKALPNDIATTAIVKALDAGVWNSNRTAVAISIPATSKSSILFVFLKSNSGQYKAVDVSGVEAANLGVIGISRNTDYARVETTPVAWLHRDDGRFQVVMRTRAWKAGQRYSVSENLLLAPDGTPLYR